MNNLPILYPDNPDTRLTATYLDEQAYSQALDVFIVVCADILFINRQQKLFYLAKRQVKPLNNWYMFGGRIHKGEREIEAAQRNLKRETGLALEKERFECVGMRRFWWQQRQQEPQQNGSDTLIYIFTVEATDEEIAKAAQSLDQNEYNGGQGIKAFTREQLLESNAHPVLLDLYDQLLS